MSETTNEEHPHLRSENLGHARREEGVDPEPAETSPAGAQRTGDEQDVEDGPEDQ